MHDQFALSQKHERKVKEVFYFFFIEPLQKFPVDTICKKKKKKTEHFQEVKISQIVPIVEGGCSLKWDI